MNNLMVSIIVPVYNAERYICQCLNSLLAQTYENFEIICVDDGSTDDTCQILQEYQAKDSRIKVIHQQNQYAGVARNNGMKLARGKYLLFLDADDFVEEYALEVLVKEAEKNKTDILVFDAYQYDNTLGKVINTPWRVLSEKVIENEVKSAKDMADEIFRFTSAVPWNKLYLREFIGKNNLKYQSLKRMNDFYFVFAALSCAERIGVVNKKLYYYRDNNSSSLQGKICETPFIFVEPLDALREYLIMCNTWRDFEKSFDRLAVSTCLYILEEMQNADIYEEVLKRIRQRIIPQFSLGKVRCNSLLINTIENKQNIIIYGAGVIAHNLVPFLLYGCEYTGDHLKIVVTDKADNVEDICEIPVESIDEVSVEHIRDLVIVAIEKEDIQKIINDSLEKRGITNRVNFEFDLFADLIRSTGNTKG